jgi:soluble lytic murein transglycosylase-like protein
MTVPWRETNNAASSDMTARLCRRGTSAWRWSAAVTITWSLACGSSAAEVAVPAAPSVSPASPTVAIDSYADEIARAASRFAIPARWIAAVMQVESAGRANAVSPKGAMGLMQLMPNTWSDMQARYHLGDNPFNPDDNIVAGAAYLKLLFDGFGASGFLGAYNAGSGHFRDYLAGLRPLSDETQRYLAKLARLLPELPIGTVLNSAGPAQGWRAGSLFVAAAGVAAAVTAPSAGPSPDGSANAPTFALAPQSVGLFANMSKADAR